VVEGILYVLRAGCRWKDLAAEYGSPVTAWRRLKRWEEDGTWECLWLTLLSKLDEAQRLDWSKAFLDGSFIPAKKGERRSA
jgi:transposase